MSVGLLGFFQVLYSDQDVEGPTKSVHYQLVKPEREGVTESDLVSPKSVQPAVRILIDTIKYMYFDGTYINSYLI